MNFYHIFTICSTYYTFRTNKKEKKMFYPEMSPITLADCVEKQLLAFIHKNNLKAGDSLPKEEELAIHLNVSRNIVREGISRLKALNLVESRKRKGLVIKEPQVFSGLQKLAEVDLLPNEDINDLNELRYALEIGLCDFIYYRKTPEKIAQLRKYASCIEPYKYTKEQEIDFHSYLVGISNNRQVIQFREIVVKIFSKKVIDKNKQIKHIPSTHQEICDALEHGTIEEFRHVMHQHFVNEYSVPMNNQI